MGRRIVLVKLWGVFANQRLELANKIGHSWFTVIMRDEEGIPTTEYFEAVDEMDAFNQAQQKLTKEEERERKRSDKTTRHPKK